MPQTDLDRIRFVTVRYRQLQGLHMVAWSGPMSIYVAAQLLTSATQDALQGFVFVLTVCTPAGFAQAFLRGYYARRFGRLGDDVDALPVEGLMLGAIGLTVVLSLLERVPIGRTVPAVLVGYAVFSGWVTARDLRFRAYYVLGSSGALGSLAIFWSTPAPTPQSFQAAVLVFHVGLTVVALLDHWLLVRTLGGHPRPGAELVDV